MITSTAVRMGSYWAIVQWKEGNKRKAKGIEVRAADAVGAAIAAPMMLDIARDTVFAIDILQPQPLVGSIG